MVRTIFVPFSAFSQGVATIYKELKRGDTGQLDKNMRREYSAELAQRRLIENIKCRGRKSPTK